MDKISEGVNKTMTENNKDIKFSFSMSSSDDELLARAMDMYEQDSKMEIVTTESDHVGKNITDLSEDNIDKPKTDQNILLNAAKCDHKITPENDTFSSDEETLAEKQNKIKRKREKKIISGKTYEDNFGYSDSSSELYDSDKDPEYNIGHCEVYKCGDEVWAACERCEILMCYKHFIDNETCDNMHGVQPKRRRKKKTLCEAPEKKVLVKKRHADEQKPKPTRTRKGKKLGASNQIQKQKKLLTRYDMTTQNNNEGRPEKRQPEDFTVDGEKREEVPIQKKERVNKQKLAKKKRNAGEEYISVKTKKVVPPRTIGQRCQSEKCAKFGRDCGKITDDSRQNIFQAYYSLCDLRLQREFLARHIENNETKRKTTKEESRRTKTNCYYLTVDSQRFLVCKNMFLSTVGISERAARTAVAKVLATGVLEQEKRGGRQSEEVKTRDGLIRESIDTHIDRFARVESHYCRASSSKEYLSSDLNLSKMYQMYCTEYSGPPPTPSFSSYKRVFKEKTLDFHRPKKDMCSLCMTYTEGNEETKTKIKQKYDNHIAEKEEVRAIKDKLKKTSLEDPSIKTASFDLQQVIHLPISQESALFYKRRLANFNLTLYDIGSKNCDCFTWHEGHSKRGSNEVATAIYKGLQRYDEQCATEINLFADGCSGQNKNSIFPAMMLYTVENSQYIDKISLRYFESFHGQSEGDSVHSTISSAIKRAGNVYVPSQLTPIFRLARNPPYNVHELQYDDFLDFKSLSKELRILKIRETEKGEELNWTSFMEIFVERNKNPGKLPYKIHFKISHREKDYHTIELKGRNINLKGYRLQNVNKDLLKIELAKYNDLKSLCTGETPIIRNQDHKQFYFNLPH